VDQGRMSPMDFTPGNGADQGRMSPMDFTPGNGVVWIKEE